MARTSMTASPVRRGTRRAADPLALAYFAVFAAILAVVGAVILFGRAPDAHQRIVLALKPAARSLAPARPAARRTPLAPLPAAPVYAGSALVADPALMEMTAEGPLPRIADDGRTPFAAYAPPAAATGKKARIAVIVTGMGLSAKDSAAALDTLPAGVTFAFVAQEKDLQAGINAARARGHEVLLQIAMEPADYPDSDPGPHTLRTGLSEEANLRRLDWALARATGYAGVGAFEGGRFLGDGRALAPVMAELTRRGLMFFDSQESAGPAAAAARQAGTLFAQAALGLDAVPAPVAIDHQLSRLEALARKDGSAIATAEPYPVSVERLARWAKGLAGRGFVLVPASAIVAPPKK
jgi:polysaccharide deacetylase 2 family uncharacterized protein YibQ